MISKMEKPEIRPTNRLEGKYLDKCTRPLEQNLEILTCGRNKFSRKLGIYISVIVTTERFPVALSAFEISSTPRFELVQGPCFGLHLNIDLYSKVSMA